MTAPRTDLPTLCRTLVANPYFFETVLALLVLNALSLGADATPAVDARYGELIDRFLILSQGLFVLEITVRICAFAPHPQRFFAKPWNAFDFTVVALSLLPAIGSLGILARLVRLLRLVRFVSVSATLQSFVTGRVHALAILLSAMLMLLMFGYIMSLAGFYLFAAHLPGWSDLGTALASVGRLVAFRLPTSAATANRLLSIPVGAVYLVLLYAGLLGVMLVAVSEVRGFRASTAGEAP